MPDALTTADSRKIHANLVVWPAPDSASPRHHPDAHVLVSKFLTEPGDGPESFKSQRVMRSTKFLWIPTGWSVQETLEVEDGEVVRIADADTTVHDPDHALDVRRVTPNTVPDIVGGAQLFGRARDWQGCGAAAPGQFYKSTDLLALVDRGGGLRGHLVRKTSVRFDRRGTLADCSVTLAFAPGAEPLVLLAREVPEFVPAGARIAPAKVG